MKKITLLALASILSVASFAQVRVAPKQLPQGIARTAKAAPSLQQAKASKVKKAQPSANAPQSVEDLVGDYVKINTSYVADPQKDGSSVAITKVNDNTISITNFTPNTTNEITATVDFAARTVTIPTKQVAYTNATYGDVELRGVKVENNQLSRDDDATALSGTINDDGSITITTPYQLFIASGDYEGYSFNSDTYTRVSNIKPANGVVEGSLYGDARSIYKHNVIISQPDPLIVRVENFGNYGQTVDITIDDDRNVSIAKQLAWDIRDSETLEDYYTCLAAWADGSVYPSAPIPGTATEEAITLDQWAVFSASGYYAGGQYQDGTLHYTNGKTFSFDADNDVAATPTAPQIYLFGPYDPSDGYGYIIFSLPTTDVDGNELYVSKLYYTLYKDIEGNVEPLVFKPGEYYYLEEELTDVPFSFVDDYDFDTDGGDRIVFLNFETEDFNRIGVQTLYTGGGEQNRSDITWYTIKAYTNGISTLTNDKTNDGSYYNLQGQRVEHPTKGVYIHKGKKIVL